jgi:exodeoxyribonuclease VIII
MQSQVIRDMTNEEYHSHPAVSKSQLDDYNKSPYHFWLRHRADERRAPVWTDAFSIGAALHAMVLEPQNYDRDFYLPYTDKDYDIADSGPALKEYCEKLELTKSGTKAELKARILEAQPDLRFEDDIAAAHHDNNTDKIFVTNDQHDLCKAMSASVEAHPEASKYIDGFGHAETSLFWQHENLECRARPDYIREDGVIVDLKSALSAQPHVWQRKAFDFRYHVQAAFYSYGYKECFGQWPKEFVFVVVEKAWPHCVLVARAGPDFIEAGMQEMRENLAGLQHCTRHNIWPSYNAERVLELGVPSYKRKLYNLDGEE